MFFLADKYIPYLRGRIEPYFDKVLYLDPALITHETVKDADVLFVRTRTLCDENLLRNTKIRFIASATIGTDHIDADYCHNNGITVVNAPGCNARAVAQYVESALFRLGIRSGISGGKNCAIGIIGVGHVGRLVQQMAERIGFKTLLYDPPRQKTEGGSQWTDSLDQIAQQADIITFHTPLTKDGSHKTYHLADEEFLARCKTGAIIINAARGGIIDEEALLQLDAKQFRLVIDTWENEPHINKRLLDKVSIATPHIAGYSDEGKRNATRMTLERLSEYMGVMIDVSDLVTSSNMLPVYDIMSDDALLRTRPDDFETLRQQYTLR